VLVATLGWLLETAVLAVVIVKRQEQVQVRGFPVKVTMAAQDLIPIRGVAVVVALVLLVLRRMRTLPVMAVLGFNLV
jgi:hypothetical protein